jgi:hypothetical protein
VVDSFEEAATVFRRIGHVSMSDSSIWRRLERWGEGFRVLEAEQRRQATALPRREGRSEARTSPAGGRMGVSVDGSKIHIREEGWKELKVGCVFDIEVRPTWDEEGKEWVDLAHAIHTSYVGYLGGPEELGQMVWTDAQQRGWEQATDTQVVGDGAVWIWNLAAEHFYDSQQTVDWYHATEHLFTAAQLLYGEDPAQVQRWYKGAQTSLFQGHADQIAAKLTQAAECQPKVAQALLTEAGYFDKNKRRMQYLEIREEGYLLGSGMVESGGKQFKARFCGSGMRWSRPGAERLIPVRAAILSDRFDETWPMVYNSPQN